MDEHVHRKIFEEFLFLLVETTLVAAIVTHYLYGILLIIGITNTKSNGW